MGLIKQSILCKAISLAKLDKMLPQAISSKGEALNNILSKQGQECRVIMHAVGAVLKQSESNARN